MAKGSPNDESMKSNFVAKVWDKKAKEYKPIYTAPDATDEVRGDVYLSDDIDSADDAKKSVTAATPKAVKDALEKAIGSTLTRDNTTIKITNGEAEEALGEFDGEETVTVDLKQLDASTVTVGELPLNVIPKSAQERLYGVDNQAARFALTTKEVQNGDTVQQKDTGELYLVKDDTKLNSEDGYAKYTAGTATKAKALDPGATIQTDLSSEQAKNFTGESAVQPGVTGTLPVKHGGTGTENGIPTTENPGLVPELPDDKTLFLNGLGTWQYPIQQERAAIAELFTDEKIHFYDASFTDSQWRGRFGYQDMQGLYWNSGGGYKHYNMITIPIKLDTGDSKYVAFISSAPYDYDPGDNDSGPSHYYGAGSAQVWYMTYYSDTDWKISALTNEDLRIVSKNYDGIVPHWDDNTTDVGKVLSIVKNQYGSVFADWKELLTTEISSDVPLEHNTPNQAATTTNFTDINKSYLRAYNVNSVDGNKEVLLDSDNLAYGTEANISSYGSYGMGGFGSTSYHSAGLVPKLKIESGIEEKLLWGDGKWKKLPDFPDYTINICRGSKNFALGQEKIGPSNTYYSDGFYIEGSSSSYVNDFGLTVLQCKDKQEIHLPALKDKPDGNMNGTSRVTLSFYFKMTDMSKAMVTLLSDFTVYIKYYDSDRNVTYPAFSYIARLDNNLNLKFNSHGSALSEGEWAQFKISYNTSYSGYNYCCPSIYTPAGATTHICGVTIQPGNIPNPVWTMPPADIVVVPDIASMSEALKYLQS